MNGAIFPRGSPEHDAWVRSIDPDYAKPKSAPAVTTPSPPRPSVSKENRPVTFGGLKIVLDAIAEAVRENNQTFAKRIADARDRLSACEFRIGAILVQVASSSPQAQKIDVNFFASKISALEKRIDELQARRLEYRGIWTDGDEYREGDFVTDHGSLWHCNVTGTRSRPGAGGDWQLAVKRGKDAR